MLNCPFFFGRSKSVTGQIAVAKFQLILAKFGSSLQHPVDVAVDSDQASALYVRRMPYYLTQPFCRKSARTCQEMYLPQRDDVPLCRDKAVQSGVVSGPREKKERKAMREDRQRQLARMATVKRRCTNLGEATDKVRDLPGYIHFVSPVVVYSLRFFPAARSPPSYLARFFWLFL